MESIEKKFYTLSSFIFIIKVTNRDYSQKQKVLMRREKMIGKVILCTTSHR